MANVKPIALQLVQSESSVSEISRRRRLSGLHGMAALKSILLVPVFPLLGYWFLDQTGFSEWLVGTGFVPSAILGEGFGHVGLCFSIHYLFTGLRSGWKAISLFLR